MFGIDQIVTMVDGFFLLFLAISGNFVAETLGCKTQYIFSKNMYVKQLIVFSMIYFTINFTSTKSPSPQESLLKSIVLWIFFLLFAKMNPLFTILAIILLLCIYSVDNYEKYLHSKKNKSKDKELKKYKKILAGAIVICILLGSFIYYKEKRLEYRSQFDLKKFFLGTINCKSLQ